MLANTKQVRKVGNAIVGFAAQWTDETSEYNKQRRSITWAIYWKSKQDVDTMASKLRAEFAKLGYTNKVTVTQDTYLRVIADLG